MLRDRLNTESPRYWFALDAALVTLSMALMWLRLLYLAGFNFGRWLRDEWRTPLFWCSMVLVPFVFWLAPLLVLVRNRRRRGLPAFPPAFWPAFFLVLNLLALLLQVLYVWSCLVLDKPVDSSPWWVIPLSLLCLASCALELDRAVARVEAGEAA